MNASTKKLIYTAAIAFATIAIANRVQAARKIMYPAPAATS